MFERIGIGAVSQSASHHVSGTGTGGAKSTLANRCTQAVEESITYSQAIQHYRISNARTTVVSKFTVLRRSNDFLTN